MENVNSSGKVASINAGNVKPGQKNKLWKGLYKSRLLYLMMAPMLIYYLLFQFFPLYGALIAFENFSPIKGIWGSQWVGFKYFVEFFHSIYLWRLIGNTLLINIYGICVGFTIPILIALAINEVNNNAYKKFVQSVLYMPHFVSMVVLVGLIFTFLSPRNGLVNYILAQFGVKPISFMTESGWFRSIYVWSGVWQNAGWESIIYLAALVGIDTALYESAIVDGASRFKRLIYITFPCLVPTIIIMFILRVGSMFNVGFEKIMLMYNPLTYEVADVISTYVYRKGILDGDFSFSTAIGLFNSLLNMIMLFSFNAFSKKVNKVSLW